MNRNSWIALLFGAVVVFAACYAGSPFLALHALKEAARSGDRDRLEEMVDFPSVRANLKDEASAWMLRSMRRDPSLANNPFAGLGLLLAPAMVDSAIDNFVTPTAIAAMVNDGKVRSGDGGEDSSQSTRARTHVDYAYLSLDRFRATVTSDGNPGDPIGFVFERRNLFGWKLIRIDIGEWARSPAAPATD